MTAHHHLFFLKRFIKRNYLLFPAIILLFPISIVPFVMIIYFSFLNIYTFNFFNPEWVGFDNFLAIFTGPDLKNSALITILFITVGVGIEVLLGLALALLFNNDFYGRSITFVAMLIPIVISQAVIGYMFLILLSDVFGVINIILSQLGFKTSILGDRLTALIAMLGIDVWIWSPFCFLIILSGLKTIPKEIMEAAKIDGASQTRLFRHIIIPLLLPSISVAAIFRTVDAFKTFDFIYIITGGGPGTATTTLPILIYRFFTAGRIGAASALSLLVFFLAFFLSRVYFNYLVIGRWKKA